MVEEDRLIDLLRRIDNALLDIREILLNIMYIYHLKLIKERKEKEKQ